MKPNKNKLIKQLADEFSNEVNHLPIIILPNGDIVYEDFLIKHTKNNLWELYNISNRYLVSKFYLKSCALMAARYYSKYLFNLYRDIKFLDRNYNKNKNDSIFLKHCLCESTDDDQKVIFLNRLECSESLAE